MDRSYPTPDLDMLPDVWAEVERKYPPTDGWGLRIFRRFLRDPDERNRSVIWGASLSRSEDETISGDGESPTAALAVILNPDLEEERRQASIRHVRGLLEEAEERVEARRKQLAEMGAE